MMTTNNELPIGTTLRGASYTYTIERVLGQGTFGITYLATTKVKADGALGALEATLHVAIKEFFMHDLNGRHGAEVTCSSKSGIYEHYRHKFAREAQNLSKLHHANIVRVLESFEANNTAYYAMEFCEGGSLDALIGGDGLAEGQAVAYAEQIGAALVAMHGERVLHLDLKPGNVMLRKDGSVALIDFGLSKQYDESGEPESSTTVGGGTPGYAPLEQAHYREGKDFPVQMDLYALGATLFKMLTGERPAEAAMLLNEGFPTEKLTAKGVSELTIAVIAKAMSPMKRDRYGSVAEFLAALKGAAAKQPIAPAPGEQTSYDDPAAEATVVDEEPQQPTPQPTPQPTLAPQPKPQPKPQPAPVPAPPKKRGGKKWLWTVVILLLVAGGFWGGRTAMTHLRKQQAFADSIALAEAERERLAREAANKTYKVGDYYNVNGKEGVVFYVDASGKHGKIVSMTQSNQIEWASDYNERRRSIGASSKTNGAANMRVIQQRPNWRADYPAFVWCTYLGDGWYLPAIEELELFTLNDSVHDAVNRTLTAKGGTRLYSKGDSGKWYWSSTEYDYKVADGTFCAWFVYMYNGYTNLSIKNFSYYVRAVSAF
ncbi:MAG: DUF1566 domain-containing protein [Rikenellaceae bacterium]|nr:DUF1566 domain-containing protein [Rikenellaceae bacterium]